MKIVKVGSGPYFGLVLQITAEGQQMFTASREFAISQNLHLWLLQKEDRAVDATY